MKEWSWFYRRLARLEWRLERRLERCEAEVKLLREALRRIGDADFERQQRRDQTLGRTVHPLPYEIARAALWAAGEREKGIPQRSCSSAEPASRATESSLSWGQDDSSAAGEREGQ
jgi:hypothetical protein